MELNRNPDNYFAEVEQAAFNPAQRRARHQLLAGQDAAGPAVLLRRRAALPAGRQPPPDPGQRAALPGEQLPPRRRDAGRRQQRRHARTTSRTATGGGIVVRRSTGSSFGRRKSGLRSLITAFTPPISQMLPAMGRRMPSWSTIMALSSAARPDPALPNEPWTRTSYYGNVGTYFADVTGDKKSDGIVINDDKVYSCIN